MNVYDFAMKMELDGKAFYEKLSAGTTIAGLKNIFSMLADDEQKHHDTVKEMREKAGKAEMADSKTLEQAQNMFIDLMAGKDLLDTMKEDLDGYRLALKIEADSVRFYENAAKRERKESVKAILLRIADEEKEHFNIVENIFDFVLRPKYFLAWGEFSNLKEF
jgi:rubrerythrin